MHEWSVHGMAVRTCRLWSREMERERYTHAHTHSQQSASFTHASEQATNHGLFSRRPQSSSAPATTKGPSSRESLEPRILFPIGSTALLLPTDNRSVCLFCGPSIFLPQTHSSSFGVLSCNEEVATHTHSSNSLLFSFTKWQQSSPSSDNDNNNSNCVDAYVHRKQ